MRRPHQGNFTDVRLQDDAGEEAEAAGGGGSRSEGFAEDDLVRGEGWARQGGAGVIPEPKANQPRAARGVCVGGGSFFQFQK